MNAPKFNVVKNGKRYNTAKATCVADDVYWDGNNFEHGGRNQWLYRTEKGNYFATYGTFWQGERDTLEPLTQAEALEMWENLPEHNVKFEEAFPGVEVEDA